MEILDLDLMEVLQLAPAGPHRVLIVARRSYEEAALLHDEWTRAALLEGEGARAPEVEEGARVRRRCRREGRRVAGVAGRKESSRDDAEEEGPSRFGGEGEEGEIKRR
jgi:hypothetical protein